MSQGKMVNFHGSKDITQAKHKEPTLQAYVAFFFSFCHNCFLEGGGGGGGGGGEGGMETYPHVKSRKLLESS